MVVLHCTILSHNKNQITGNGESTAMQTKYLPQQSCHTMSYDTVSYFFRSADTDARFSCGTRTYIEDQIPVRPGSSFFINFPKLTVILDRRKASHSFSILCIHISSGLRTKRKRKGSSSDNPIVLRRECRSNFKLSVSLCPLLFWQPELFFRPSSPCAHGNRVHETSAHYEAGMSLYPFSLSEHLLTSKHFPN